MACLFGNRDRTAVVVGTVTDDQRLETIPKLSVAALRFTESARARIVKAGGSCQTIDELIMKSPSGMFERTNRVLIDFFLSLILIYNYNRLQHPPS